MRGLKASLAVVVITVITCTAIAAGGHKKTETASSNSPQKDIITGAGTFPGNMLCMYADDDGIYYCSYGDNGKVLLYSRYSQESGTVLESIKSEHNISSFVKYKNYTAWEETSVNNEDDEDKNEKNHWELYLKKDTGIKKIDEGDFSRTTQDDDIFAPTGEFSSYGSYIVYSTYGVSSKGGDTGVSIKLYDTDRQQAKTIFSLADTGGRHVSDPFIYKDYIVWGISGGTGDNNDIYLYSITAGSYSKVVQGGKLMDPMLWEDYIICSSEENGVSSIVLINIKSGVSKDIASIDQSLLGYSAGDGYVVWSNSSMDGVYVYDIRNDATYQLDRIAGSDNIAETLINIKIYGKTVTYTDHRFKKDTGDTVSETGKYLVLR